MRASRHVVFVQYGDYREAVERFAAGGPETYAAQRYSVEFVASLTGRARVTVIALPPGPYDELLRTGVRAIGMGWEHGRDVFRLLRTLERLRPTHLVVATPLLWALLWGVLRAERVLPLFADSFAGSSWRRRMTESVIAWILNRDKIEVVANHNVPAALDLVRLGVDPRKVVPWDWPARDTPFERTPKDAPDPNRRFTLFFAGSISEEKGVGDVIEAIALLRRRRLDVGATFVGSGAIDSMQRLARSRDVDDVLEFMGRVPNERVPELMRDHSAVVVPSRPSYPEGLPLTIYEGLCSRSPVLLSNHPMFVRAFAACTGVKMFRAGDPRALAEAVYEVATDREQYRRLSHESAAAWQSIQVPLKFGELLDHWLEGTARDISLVTDHSVRQTRHAVS